MRSPTIFTAVLLLALATAGAAEPPELARIERSIKRQPAYTAEKPLFGLYAFGPEAKTRVWVVLDKSAADNDQFDVLYFDRDADGDLTDENERIAGKISEPGRGVTFSIGDFTDPDSKQVHTGLTLTRRPSDDGSVMLKLTWQGREVMHGGYADEAGPYTQFASSIAEAPILWFDATGAFAFQPWSMNRELTIGSSVDVRVFLGHQGIGKNTFCAVSQEFLPRGVKVLATLVYTDREGREQHQLSEFPERC